MHCLTCQQRRCVDIVVVLDGACMLSTFVIGYSFCLLLSVFINVPLVQARYIINYYRCF